MLTTLKTQSVTKWTWSGTGFVRESPGEKQLAVPKRRQVYKRARYYDPSTGEFISRDPLEYVDGMSLYRGHFVPGGVDPTGEIKIGKISYFPGNPCKQAIGVQMLFLQDGENIGGFPHFRPTRGYYIQRVEFSCTECKCGTCGECLPFGCEKKGPYVYYEVWKSSNRARPGGKGRHIDWQTFSNANKSCLSQTRSLEVRFYEGAKIDFSKDPKWTQDKTGKRHFGGGNCKVGPGILWAFDGNKDGEPDIWKTAGEQSKAGGEKIINSSISFSSNCCNEPGHGGYEFKTDSKLPKKRRKSK